MKGLGYTFLALAAVGTTQIANAELRDAGDFDAAGFTFTPNLKGSVGFDDNITTASGSATNPEISANVYKLAPSLNAKTEFGDFVGLSIDTAAEKGVYSGQAFNNYYDYSFGTDLGFKISNKQNLVLDYLFARSHDPAGGSSATSPVPAIEKFRTNTGGLTYNLGNKDSVARLELGVNGEGKRYKETLAQTKDFDAEQVDAAVFVGVAPKTAVFIQAIATEYDFLNVDSLDNDDQKLYLGVQWEATAKTSGKIKVGQQDKEYTKRTPIVEQDETTWEAGVKWEPKSYSAFTLGLSSQVDNGNGNSTVLTETAVDRSVVSLGWEHSWNEDVKTTLGTSLTNEKYLGQAGVDTRAGLEADVLAFNAGMEFQVERNFTINMNYNYTDKEAKNADGTVNLSEQYTRGSAVVFGVEIGL